MSRHRFLAALDRADFARPYGFVRRVAPGLVEASGPAGRLGELCEIEGESGDILLAEVAAVDERRVVLIPLEQQATVRPDARVVARPMRDRVAVGDAFAGRAVDSLGRPIDGGGEIAAEDHVALAGSVPRPMNRADPARVLPTGIRAIDGLLTLGQGQRVGIFAASGVGKTSLMEQLATQIECDRVVLCLVGERGREVEAIWRMLSKREDKARYTLVAATSDESAALRGRSVSYALALAEHWRDSGDHVLLMVDSVTRLAMALREIGLAAGAPPTVRAYTPNVFGALPRLVERCGAVRSGGAITAIMTVLSETDDVDDPIVELMKSLLDGHIVLSRSLAEQGHFPAIDVPRSVSRGAQQLVAADQAAAMREAVAQLAAYEEARVMIESGVYKAGTNGAVDRAIAKRGEMNAFLRQPRTDDSAFAETVRKLRAITAERAAMRDKVKLPLMVKLASVQRIKAAAAEAALMSARAAEKAARSAEEDALARTDAARADWGEHLSGGRFSPEFSRALAARVIERETAASSASLRRERSSELAERRQEEWQVSDARSRSGDNSLRRLRRRVRRRIDEDRLAETADRITFDWSRR